MFFSISAVVSSTKIRKSSYGLIEAAGQIVVCVFAVVEMETAEAPFVNQVGDDVFDVHRRERGGRGQQEPARGRRIFAKRPAPCHQSAMSV